LTSTESYAILKEGFFQSLVLDISTEKRAFMLSILSLPCAPVSIETVTALGFFDGVHRGHRALLDATVRLASSLGVKPAVFTFSGTFKGKAPLTDESTRLRLFEEAGIEAVFLVDFDAVRSLSPEDFVKNCLQGVCRARAAVCGFNYRFGHGAAGDAEALVRYMKEIGRENLVLDPLYAGGELLSSRAIRAHLQKGEVERAAELLGAPYALSGRVESGDGRGRTLGFPTVNLPIPEGRALLPNGVYATVAHTVKGNFPSVTNVGTCPTFGERLVHAETHLCEFSGDLYGEVIDVQFLKRLRDEKTFSSKEELIKQINIDKNTSMEVFKAWQEAGRS
jgi:riboflavin kinase/FMN adenylyltransferase